MIIKRKKTKNKIRSLAIVLITIIFPTIINSPLFMNFRGNMVYLEENPLGEPNLSSSGPPNSLYFNFYKNITIDHTRVSGTGIHYNFPVLISILDEDLRNDVQPDGDDIAFACEGSWLDHEIELFNQAYSGTEAQLIAWVKVPSLSTAQDTIISMYYGNSTMSSRQNPEGVWDNQYEAVYHLHDDFLDSSSNSRDGTNSGSVDVAGRIGDGQDFERNDNSDNINIGTWSVSGTAITIQAWVRFESFAVWDARILSKNSGTNDGEQYHVWMLGTSTGPNRLRARIKTGTSDYYGTTTVVATSGDLSTDTWYLTTLKYDGIFMSLALNGNSVGVFSKSGQLRVNNWPISIGNSPTGGRPIDAIIDEVRISSVIRSNYWLQTEYNNQNDPDTFYSVGTEQTVSISPLKAEYFNYYKIITIDHTKVSGTGSHVNFPLLISILDEDLHDDVQADGDDIAFASEGAWLDHQIELFNQIYSSTHAQLVVWVRVPFLSTSIDTNITIYYGNSTMDSRENPAAVWDSGYVGVWHLNEDPSGTAPQMKDSTSPPSDGSSSGFMTSSDQVSGMIGGALDFDGIDDNVDFSNPPELQITGEITFQAWFKATGTILEEYLICKSDGSGNRGWDLSFDPLDTSHAWMEFRYSADGINWELVGYERVTLGKWYHAIAIFKPSEYAKFFLNGTIVGIDTTGIPPSQNDPPFNFRIAEKADGSDNFEGIIDEARVSNIARSDGWIISEYNNQYDPSSFYYVGSEKTVKPKVYLEAQINAIDLYGNFLPNVNISMYQNTTLIDSDISNANGSVLFSNISQGEYNFTATIISTVQDITEVVNSTSQPILLDKGFQIINLLCDVGTNFFEVIDIDGNPLDSGWIVVGNTTHELQNCIIDNMGRTIFYWVNTTPYSYNYSVYYQDNDYIPQIIKLTLGNITSANSTIQLQVGLTTVEFTVLTIGNAEPVSGAKLILRINDTFGDNIVNLTTDLNGKATLRWLNSSGISGDYSLQIEFFGFPILFNNTAGEIPSVSEISFTVNNEDSMEFRVSITLENYRTELVSLNPIDYILVDWGSQLKIRILFNVTKAVGLPLLLGPTFADYMQYQLLLGGNPVQSGQIFKEENNLGRHSAIIDTKELESDTTYVVIVSAHKSGFTLPSDLILQLNVLENVIELNQSQNDDSTTAVYWSDSVNMSVKSYGNVFESFTVENALFQNIDHEFNFSIPDIQNNWNLSRIIFNFYSISWNTGVSNINITIEDPDGSFYYMFHSSNHTGWDYAQRTWTGITLDLNKASPTKDNKFGFKIGGSFDNTVDIITDAYFIRDKVDMQYSKFNITDTISISSEVEGWAIKNITFVIKDCYDTSTWNKVNLSTLTNLNITTNEGHKYFLDDGDVNGNGILTIDNRIIYPLAGEFLFTIESLTNVSFNTIIKVEYVQEFYKNQHLETYNLTILEQGINNGGIFQIDAGESDWNEDEAKLLIKGINDGISYFLPSDIAMTITIGTNTYSVSDYVLGEGTFSLDGFSKNVIFAADINTNQPVHFSLFLIIEYSRILTYETVGTVNYIIREAPSVFGVVPYDPDLGYYLQVIDTSLIDADEYTVRFTFIKDHFTTTIKDLYLIVENRLTLINGSSEFYRKIEDIYVEDAVIFEFLYTDAITGTKITDLDTSYYIWESYDKFGNVIDSGQGDIISTVEDLYTLDFDTETRAVGDYLLILTLEKDNYNYKNAMILLTINKRELDYALSENFRNYEISVVQGKTIPIVLNLTDRTRGGIPLENAIVKLTISGIDYEFEPLPNGTYKYNFDTADINAFFTSKTLRGIINISVENYISVEFSIVIVVKMEEIFPGVPTFYFLLILSAILVFAGSIVGYRIYKHAKIPTFVKKVREMKKAIEGEKDISESLLYRSKEAFVGERVRDKWDKIGLSLEDILGLKIEKKLTKVEKKISEMVKRREMKPIGLIVMKWDERIGTEIMAKYPGEVVISEKTLMQIYSTHEYSGEKGIITLMAGSMNIVSYYTGSEKGYYLILLLNLDDDADVYEGGMASTLRIILDNIEDESYIQMLPSLFQRLSVYPSLNDEEILALDYQDEIKRMIIENLRDVGVVTKSELSIWLRDRYVEGFVDLEATLLELMKKDIIKQVSIKGLPSELIVLTNDIFMLRVPPIKLLADPVNRGLPTQFAKIYPAEVKKFFQDYRPTREDNLKIVEILINPQVYETLRLLRSSIVTRQDLEKLRKKGVQDIYGVLKLLWDNQLIKVYQDENNNEYYALLSDFYTDLIFPKYLLKVIKVAYEQKSKADKVLIEYLNVLEDTYFKLKSEKKS